MTQSNLIGTWQLLSVSIDSASGERILPFGEYPLGQIVYTAEGDVSIVIMRKERDKFSSDNSFEGNPAEIIKAFHEFDAYYGNYAVDIENSNVTHFIKGCRFPNWEGTEQIRHYQLNGNHLLLTAPPISLDGQEWIAHLCWQRK